MRSGSTSAAGPKPASSHVRRALCSGLVRTDGEAQPLEPLSEAGRLCFALRVERDVGHARVLAGGGPGRFAVPRQVDDRECSRLSQPTASSARGVQWQGWCRARARGTRPAKSCHWSTFSGSERSHAAWLCELSLAAARESQPTSKCTGAASARRLDRSHGDRSPARRSNPRFETSDRRDAFPTAVERPLSAYRHFSRSFATFHEIRARSLGPIERSERLRCGHRRCSTPPGRR